MVQDEEGREADKAHQITWYKVGKGKSAQPAIGIQKYEATNGSGYHILHHGPDRVVILSGLLYSELARGIAKEILEQLNANLLRDDWMDLLLTQFRYYLRYYRVNYAVKKPMGFDEFTGSIEHEQQVSEEYNRRLAIRQAKEHLQELYEGNQSLAFMADADGDITGRDLSALLDGRPLDSAAVSPLAVFYETKQK